MRAIFPRLQLPLGWVEHSETQLNFMSYSNRFRLAWKTFFLSHSSLTTALGCFDFKAPKYVDFGPFTLSE
jgi:hypothetical protein